MMRELSDIEAQNIDFLETHDIKYATVFLTSNILYHGIFDATKQIQQFLKDSGIHNFDEQKSGEKAFVRTHIISFTTDINCRTSLYRAEKRGDKRMWFGSEIYSFVNENDICAIVEYRQEMYVMNISIIDLELCYHSQIDNPIKSALNHNIL